MWILGDRVERAFDSGLVPFLGFLFLPVTTLVYTLVWDAAGMTFWEGSLVAFAVLADLAGPAGALRTSGRRSRNTETLA